MSELEDKLLCIVRLRHEGLESIGIADALQIGENELQRYETEGRDALERAGEILTRGKWKNPDYLTVIEVFSHEGFSVSGADEAIHKMYGEYAENYFSRRVLNKVRDVRAIEEAINGGALTTKDIKEKTKFDDCKINRLLNAREIRELFEVTFEKGLRKLAKEELTREEIAVRLNSDYSRICKVLKDKDIDVERKKIIRDSKMKRNETLFDEMILEGGTLQQIGKALGVTRERIRQYINQAGLHEFWEECKAESKSESKRIEERRQRLLGEVAGIILDTAKEKADWAERKAFEYMDVAPLTRYSFGTLSKLFKTYYDAEESGEKLSLYKLEEATEMSFTGIGQVLSCVGLEPMCRSVERRGPLSEGELDAIRRIDGVAMPVWTWRILWV